MAMQPPSDLSGSSTSSVVVSRDPQETHVSARSPRSGTTAYAYVNAPGPAGESAGGQQIVLVISQVWHAIVRWWKIALPAGLLLGGTAAAIAWWNFVPEYRSTATLLVYASAPHIVFPAGVSGSQVGTQLQIMKTPKVLTKALENLGQIEEIRTLPDPVNWIKSGLTVAVVPGSELYTVGFQHPKPETAQAVVDEVVRSYLVFSQEFDEAHTKKMISLLEKEEKNLASVIARLTEILTEKAKKLTGNDPVAPNSARPRPAESPAAGLKQQLVSVDLEETEMKVELEILQTSTDDASDPLMLPAAIAERIETHPDVESLKRRIAFDNAQLVDLDAKLSGAADTSTYRRFQRDLEQAEQSLEQLRSQLAEELSEEAKMEAKRLRDAKEQDLKRNLGLLAARKEALEAKLKEETERMAQTGDDSMELDLDRVELERKRKVRDMIAERKFSLTTELDAPPRMSQLEQADVPKNPVEILPLKKLLVMGLGGLLLPFGLAIGWEQIQSRIGDSSQLVKSNVRVVGEVAMLPGATVSLLGRRGHHHSSLFEESVQSLCTRLRLSQDLRKLQVLAVCSAVSGEGKTSLVTQLAVSIEKSLRRTTLLIDADMRSPDLCHMFDIPNEPGLAQVLSRECTYEEAIFTGLSDKLHVMPAGRAATSPHTLLGTELFAEMIAELRERYDFILIDAPPLLSSSEALVVAAAADASLLCARRNFSRTGQIREAYQRLIEADARPIGAVLNGVSLGKYASHYGRYPADSNL
jgi:capsular exopolysaccharide synthesis family protein